MRPGNRQRAGPSGDTSANLPFRAFCGLTAQAAASSGPPGSSGDTAAAAWRSRTRPSGQCPPQARSTCWRAAWKWALAQARPSPRGRRASRPPAGWPGRARPSRENPPAGTGCAHRCAARRAEDQPPYVTFKLVPFAPLASALAARPAVLPGWPIAATVTVPAGAVPVTGGGRGLARGGA
jgi:hypothetical protein